MLSVAHPQEDKTLFSRGLEGWQANASRVKLGTIGSGNSVSKELVYRRQFAQQHRVSAYDIGLHHVMGSLFKSRLGGEDVAMVLGISDYLNGSVTKSWQPHSSLVAAAVCKEMVRLL